jgi:hypothetical protein
MLMNDRNTSAIRRRGGPMGRAMMIGGIFLHARDPRAAEWVSGRPFALGDMPGAWL